MRLAQVRIYNSFYNYIFTPQWACSQCGLEFAHDEIFGKFTVAKTTVCPLCGRKLNKENVVLEVDTHKMEKDRKAEFDALKAAFGTHGCKAVAAMLDPSFRDSPIAEREFGTGWEFNAEFTPFPEVVPFQFKPGEVPKRLDGEDFEELRIYVFNRKIAERVVPHLSERFGDLVKAEIEKMFGKVGTED